MFRSLGRIKLNKITDKGLRSSLVSNHLKMFKVAKENDDYIMALRQQFDPDATRELNEAYDQYAGEEVSIDLQKIDRDTFVDIIANSDIEFTLSDMILLEPLFREE